MDSLVHIEQESTFNRNVRFNSAQMRQLEKNKKELYCAHVLIPDELNVLPIDLIYLFVWFYL